LFSARIAESFLLIEGLIPTLKYKKRNKTAIDRLYKPHRESPIYLIFNGINIIASSDGNT